MKIAITGARGLVGQCLAHSLKNGHEVSALAHEDLDICDADAVRNWCLRNQPERIFNCAVLQVDACELSPDKAEAVNVTGPRNLALAAAEISADLVHFSTNYVFDGEPDGRAPYTAGDETRPVNVYGRTKLDGERAVTRMLPASFIVRTAWVYGRGKESFLASVPRKLRAGEKILAIVDAFSTTTYVRDLVDRSVEIAEGGRYGIYHVANEGTCSYYDFALQVARMLGMNDDEVTRLIVPVKESEMQRPARRPRWTPLCSVPPLREWREALAAYIAEGGIKE